MGHPIPQPCVDKKGKVMAKKKTDRVTVKDVIAELNLSEDAVVFIHIYNKAHDIETTVKDIASELMKKKVIKIFPHFGGIKHDYGCYRIIVDK